MAKFILKFIAGKYQGTDIPMPTRGELLIGRINEANIVLAEDMISRKHAKLIVDGDTLILVDLGSTNGTFVNGEKISRTNINIGDKILLGTSLLKVTEAGDKQHPMIPTPPAAPIEATPEISSDTNPSYEPEKTSMRGDIDDIPLADLLQLFSSNKKTGSLTLTGDVNGTIYLQQGSLQHAVTTNDAKAKPIDALGILIACKKGHFYFESVSVLQNIPTSFQGSTESLLLQATQHYDELQHSKHQLPPLPDSVALTMPFQKRLADLDDAMLDFLQLAANEQDVQIILEMHHDHEQEAIEKLRYLLQEKYLINTPQSSL